MGREDDCKGILASDQMPVSDPGKSAGGDAVYHRGRFFSEYKELAEKLGIADRVCFAGLQKNPFPWLSAGSLYVGTSSMEGFPNALVEAMSCRLPAVFFPTV